MSYRPNPAEVRRQNRLNLAVQDVESGILDTRLDTEDALIGYIQTTTDSRMQLDLGVLYEMYDSEDSR